MGNFKKHRDLIAQLLLVFVLVLQNPITSYGRRRDLQTRSRFCRNYPDGSVTPFRFHRESKRCHQVGERGPCKGEFMKFTLEDDDFGFCDCDLSKRCGRPLVFWPSRNRCYHAYDQGPCREGKWLVFGFNLEPVCKKNICLDMEEKEPSYGSRYWFNMNQTCYRTFTQSYCSKDEILFNMNLHYRPTCQKSPDCGEISPAQVAKCLPGQRLDSEGHCRRKFLALRNTTKPLTIHVTQKPPNIYCLFCDEKRPQKYKI